MNMVRGSIRGEGGGRPSPPPSSSGPLLRHVSSFTPSSFDNEDDIGIGSVDGNITNAAGEGRNASFQQSGLEELEHPLSVFIRDDIFSWLPAKLFSVDYTNSPPIANVVIKLPSDWNSTTTTSVPIKDGNFGGGGGGGGIGGGGGAEMIQTGAGVIGRRRARQSHHSYHHHHHPSIPPPVEIPKDALERCIDLSCYPNKSLPRANVDATTGEPLRKSDVADLPYLHEAAVLYNVKDRHAHGVPYTRVNDIIVAMNPFQWIDGLYSKEKQMFYANSLVWDAPLDDDEKSQRMMDESVSTYGKQGVDPHVYEASALSYRGLALDGIDQAILVSGESGAGKTETVKIVMSHIALIQSMMTSDGLYDGSGVGGGGRVGSGSGSGKEDACVVTKLLESNSIFEAFGNAKTVRNDNSSRFGKFVQLQFDTPPPMNKASNKGRSMSPRSQFRLGKPSGVPICRLIGSNSETYLLEKSRVVNHDPGERTYHIFYQLLSAPKKHRESIWDGLITNDKHCFKYVYHAETHVSSGSSSSGSGSDDEEDASSSSVENGEEDDEGESASSSEDAKQWNHTKRDLELFGIKGDEFTSLMRALCIVMQLGNISFAPSEDENDDSTERTIISNVDELDKLSELMGLDGNEIAVALTTRTMRARSDEFQVFLNPSVCKDGCDALAKEIYARIFDMIVRTINLSLRAPLSSSLSSSTTVDEHAAVNNNGDGKLLSSPKRGGGGGGGGGGQGHHHHLPTISLLDLFGFESFEINRFEQLCINYANEKLQQKYVMDNFNLVQDEYQSEGIELFDLSMVDNKDVLELIEGRIGIIMTLNDECLRPNGNDSSFVYKIKTLHKASNLLIQKKLHRPYEFGVLHFAGPVTYDARNIIERNNDKLPPDLLDCASFSTNLVLRREFEGGRRNAKPVGFAPPTTYSSSSDGGGGAVGSKSGGITPRGGGGSSRSPGAAGGGLRTTTTKSFSTGNTVASKFRSQLVRMMSRIETTRTRYIRCIRPNQSKLPKLTDHITTMSQLTSAGLVTAITISRETFPDRLDYSLIVERFRCLTPDMDDDNDEKFANSTARECAEHILSKRLDGFVVEIVGGLFRSPYACGKTKVYFRPGALERLESDRIYYYGKHVSKIQRWFRCLLDKWKYRALLRAALSLQCELRVKLAKKRYRKIRYSVIVLQAHVRGSVTQQKFWLMRVNHAAVLIQTRYRARKPMVTMEKWRNAARIIQRCVRRKRDNADFADSLAKCVEEARKEHQLKALQRQLSDMSIGDVSTEVKSITADSKKMLDYYRSELFTLRYNNSELRSNLTKVKDENKKLQDFQDSFDAAITVSNRRIVQLGRSNQNLAEEVATEKRKSSALLRQFKNEQMKHDEDINELQDKYESRLQEMEQSTLKLRKEYDKRVKSHERKMSKRDREISKLKRAHSQEVDLLKDELQSTQEIHNDYLSKLMDVLETAHASREAEALRLTDEFETALMHKDEEIVKLKRDVKTLRGMIARMQQQHQQHR